jgi:U3 small nucleolar ribonucleoprotein protein IMP4
LSQSHVDDEYASAGVRDPKICLTTSRDPSSRLRQFSVEMKLVFPNSQRINRGNTTIKEIVDAAREADFTDIIVLQETRGEPDALIVSHLPFGPSVFFSLSGTVLRHDIEGSGTVSEAYPHLIFNNFKTPVGLRVMTVLQHLFPVPKPDSKRVITFSNESDFISFRHHTYDKEGTGKDSTSKLDIKLKEVGPRCEFHPYQIRLGTVDQAEAEVEWVLRPYMNTARKHDAL